jgi:hypothetical protein
MTVTMTRWHDDTITVTMTPHHDAMTPWRHDTMTPCIDTMTPWHQTPWHHDAMTPWHDLVRPSKSPHHHTITTITPSNHHTITPSHHHSATPSQSQHACPITSSPKFTTNELTKSLPRVFGEELEVETSRANPSRTEVQKDQMTFPERGTSKHRHVIQSMKTTQQSRGVNSFLTMKNDHSKISVQKRKTAPLQQLQQAGLWLPGNSRSIGCEIHSDATAVLRGSPTKNK